MPTNPKSNSPATPLTPSPGARIPAQAPAQTQPSISQAFLNALKDLEVINPKKSEFIKATFLDIEKCDLFMFNSRKIRDMHGMDLRHKDCKFKLSRTVYFEPDKNDPNMSKFVCASSVEDKICFEYNLADLMKMPLIDLRNIMNVKLTYSIEEIPGKLVSVNGYYTIRPSTLDEIKERVRSEYMEARKKWKKYEGFKY
ncbi:MAG: hypothetical protein KGO96_06825 [Elusimicrobia bacterium]|nr:hypothetical protein [Elusimicrobiota bacterium]